MNETQNGNKLSFLYDTEKRLTIFKFSLCTSMPNQIVLTLSGFNDDL